MHRLLLLLVLSLPLAPIAATTDPAEIPESVAAWFNDKALATGYTQIAREGGSILLRSGDYQGPRTECGPLAG